MTQHKGPMRSLAIDPLNSHDRFQLARFGLDLNETSCVTFRSRINQFTSCPLVRSEVPQILAVDTRSQTIMWNAPSGTSARVYVKRDSNDKNLFGDGLQGYEKVTWLTPGHRFVFELYAWDGKTEGSLLAIVTIDEQGNVTSKSFVGAKIPAINKQAFGLSGDK